MSIKHEITEQKLIPRCRGDERIEVGLVLFFGLVSEEHPGGSSSGDVRQRFGVVYVVS